MSTAWIALGSNLHDPRAQLRAALLRIAAVPGVSLRRQSSFYRSKPLGPGGQADYCNAVCAVSTDLGPLALLRVLQQVEDGAGRDRSGPRWGPRTLDLDLLLYDAQVLVEVSLQLPHPQMHRRNFVLAPLVEVDPDAVIPGKGRADALLASVGRVGLTSWTE